MVLGDLALTHLFGGIAPCTPLWRPWTLDPVLLDLGPCLVATLDLWVLHICLFAFACFVMTNVLLEKVQVQVARPQESSTF